MNPITYSGPAAVSASDSARASFLRKTYLHLAGAIVAFIALEGFLLTSGIAEPLVGLMLGGRWSWMIVLGGFMAVGWIAERFAQSHASVGTQYFGLALYVFAQGIVTLPLLYIAAYQMGDASLITQAGLYTLLIFTGLTGTVLITGKDFTFLRGALTIAGFAALGLVVASMIFGFTLGTVFAAAMVVLVSGYILFHTSNIVRNYPVGSHVAASLALFSSVALLFWYVLRILMGSRR